jgi:YD repeat-containing protein
MIAIGRASAIEVMITIHNTGETNYTYDKGGQLYSVDVDNIGSLLTTDIVNSIQYNAKGQRTRIQYENGSTTTYEYDPNTFRVTRIRTTRAGDSETLRDLKYWYDPVGNITIQQDDAQQTIFFNNAIVSPDNDYTYDALYRLIIAKGREHVGNSHNAPDHHDADRIIP